MSPAIETQHCVEKSLNQYNAVMAKCKELFLRKHKDYGSAWRILRLPSLTDQIFIKASRIRNIEEQGLAKIEDKVEDEYIGIINYCLMALIQHSLGDDDRLELSSNELEPALCLKTRIMIMARFGGICGFPVIPT